MNIQPIEPESKNPQENKQKAVGVLLIEAGMEFALLIALPLVGGVFAGKWLDSKYNHKFFVIIGILAGLAISSFAIYKRIKEYQNILKNK